MLSFIKKIFSIFSIFNLTFVSSAQAAATFVNTFNVNSQSTAPTSLTFNNNGTKMFVLDLTGDDINFNFLKSFLTVWICLGVSVF